HKKYKLIQIKHRSQIGTNKKTHFAMSGFFQNLGSPTWARTRDLRINSPSLYRLSYGRIDWLSNLGSNQGPADEQSVALPTELLENLTAIIESFKKGDR